ncbi:MAG: hypothetical protein IJU37_01360 [Desulfovibrio sp.]|nr:hypothetical protein [Desulfovibrio sp.]
MKKKSMLLVLVVLVGLLGLQQWLQAIVENLARETVASVSLSPDGKPAKGSVEVVDFSPLSRTLLMQGIRIEEENADMHASVESVTMRLSMRFMLAMTPLRSLVLSEQSEAMLLVAEDVRAEGLEWKIPQQTCAIKTHETKHFCATQSLVQHMLAGKGVDALDIIYESGAESIRITDMRIKTRDNATELDTQVQGSALEGWEGSHIRSLSLDAMSARTGGIEDFTLRSMTYADIHLPKKELVRQLWQALLKHGQDSDALVTACRPLLEKMMAAGPLVEKIRLGALRMKVEGQDVRLGEAGFDHSGGEKGRIAGFFQGLELPRGLFKDTGLLLPDLKLDFRGSLEHPKADEEKHSYTLSAAGLADVSCALTLHGNASLLDEQALLLRSVSDVRLDVLDKGALAWIGRNMGGEARAVSQRLEHFLNDLALNDLGWRDSPQNRKMLEDLRTFVRTPGRLELRSQPGERIGLLRLSELAGNPGALLTLRVTPGSVPLDRAILSLPGAE